MFHIFTFIKYCSVVFIWDFILSCKSKNVFAQHSKQHYKKVLLSSFHLHVLSLGVHTHTKVRTTEPVYPLQHNKQDH